MKKPPLRELGGHIPSWRILFNLNHLYGGEGGIRTPDTRKGMPDFESGAFNRALPPLRFVHKESATAANSRMLLLFVVLISLLAAVAAAWKVIVPSTAFRRTSGTR
jgi:hypothetical protein